jgi:hypothetical protein
MSSDHDLVIRNHLTFCDLAVIITILRRQQQETEMTYETRIHTIATHAWEIWTNNGLGLDDEARFQTGKSAQDAAANSYQDDMTDQQWLDATIAQLRG